MCKPEDRYRGRVFGALGTTQALLMLIGTLLGGALGDALGIVPVLVVQGGAYVLAGILVLILLSGVAVGKARPEKDLVDSPGRYDGRPDSTSPADW